MNETHLESLFGALGNVNRIRIIRFLISMRSKPTPHISMIADHVGIKTSLCSRHISTLVDSGLISTYAAGQHRLVEINCEYLGEMEELLNLMKGSNEKEKQGIETQENPQTREVDRGTGNSSTF